MEAENPPPIPGAELFHAVPDATIKRIEMTAFDENQVLLREILMGG